MVRLDLSSQKLCTIITPWGKYQYQRLPMGVNVSPDVFQEKMSGLMEGLESVHTYLDDLLIISNGSFDDHLQQLDTVLHRLRIAGLKINVEKSAFFAPEIEYLGYLLTKEGIKPVLNKNTCSIRFTASQYTETTQKSTGYDTVLQGHVAKKKSHTSPTYRLSR